MIFEGLSVVDLNLTNAWYLRRCFNVAVAVAIAREQTLQVSVLQHGEFAKVEKDLSFLSVLLSTS